MMQNASNTSLSAAKNQSSAFYHNLSRKKSRYQDQSMGSLTYAQGEKMKKEVVEDDLEVEMLDDLGHRKSLHNNSNQEKSYRKNPWLEDHGSTKGDVLEDLQHKDSSPENMVKKTKNKRKSIKNVNQRFDFNPEESTHETPIEVLGFQSQKQENKEVRLNFDKEEHEDNQNHHVSEGVSPYNLSRFESQDSYGEAKQKRSHKALDKVINLSKNNYAVDLEDDSREFSNRIDDHVTQNMALGSRIKNQFRQDPIEKFSRQSSNQYPPRDPSEMATDSEGPVKLKKRKKK